MNNSLIPRPSIEGQEESSHAGNKLKMDRNNSTNYSFCHKYYLHSLINFWLILVSVLCEWVDMGSNSRQLFGIVIMG